MLIDKESFNISPIIFSMSDGLVTGRGLYIKDPKAEKLYDAKLEIRGIDLERLVGELGTDKKIVSGRLDADIDLFGKRGVTIKEGLNGRVSLNSTKGKLWKFPVITKIFSLVNIISINNLFESGLEYKEIRGKIDIKDGILFTEDLLFDSSSLRMSAFGKIDYPQDKIDATLGFHPFVTIDKIINLIPLAGWIISGKNESAITMYYEVKGRLKNPDVYAVPVKSLGKGIFGILERTMKLPGQVLTPGAMNGEKKKNGAEKKFPEEPEAAPRIIKI